MTNENPADGWTRRQIVTGAPAASFIAAGWFIGKRPSWAVEVEPASLIVPRNKAVMVLGANGLTGRECIKSILAEGRTCVATSRSGRFDGVDELSSEQQQRLMTATVDVSSL